MLCDTVSPSEQSLCNHRFVVESGRPSVVVIFLLPVPPVAMFSMAKSSCADRTTLVVKVFTNTWDFNLMWPWCNELVSRVGVVRRREMCKHLSFYHTFYAGIFHQKVPKADVNIF